jgi:hypothetical protein
MLRWLRTLAGKKGWQGRSFTQVSVAAMDLELTIF